MLTFAVASVILLGQAPTKLSVSPKLALDAASAVIIDADSGKVLFQKDADTPRYPASTTKIMTAMLVMEHCQPTDIITGPPDIDKVQPSSMNLKPGEKVTAHDLVYAMLLRSANDTCVAAATHISGSVPAFAKLMNERAKQIGCTNTHFDNPNGLPDPLHTTTAHDLALIARQAMKLPPFQQVVRTKRYTVSRSINIKDREMVNKNKWLFKDPTADGVKTGFTTPAGQCYVGSATRDGFRVITVILKSHHWQNDHKSMLDWAFGRYRRQWIKPADQVLLQPTVEGGASKTVGLGPAVSVGTLVDKRHVADPAWDVLPNFHVPLKAPIKKGEYVGTAEVRDVDGFIQSVRVVALEDVPLAPVSVLSSSPISSAGVIGGTLVLGTLLVRRRARRSPLYGRSLRY